MQSRRAAAGPARAAATRAAPGRPLNGADEGGPSEVLEGGSARVERWAEHWPGVSPRTRRRARVVTAIGLAAALVVAMVVGGRAWLAERALEDEVALAAQLDVWSSSSSPPRGRVDYFAVVSNLGPRPVRITGVSIEHLALHARSRPRPPDELGPGESFRIPLSVVLDCRRGTPADGREIPGTISAVPPSGAEHRVDVRFDRAVILTGMARFLCRMQPDLHSGELSGPIH